MNKKKSNSQRSPKMRHLGQKLGFPLTLAWETNNVFNKGQLKTIIQSKYQVWNGNAPGTLVRHSLNCRKCHVNLAHTILHRSIISNTRPVNIASFAFMTPAFAHVYRHESTKTGNCERGPCIFSYTGTPNILMRYSGLKLHWIGLSHILDPRLILFFSKLRIR